MATLKLNKLLLTAIAVTGIIVSTLPNASSAQHCRFTSDQCCSRWGYCGTGDAYCGIGCQEGLCSKPPPTNHVSVAKVVTKAFFDGLIGEAAEGCEGKGFYLRGTFLEAVGSYPRFGRVGSIDNSKRFLLHKLNSQYPCNPHKGYLRSWSHPTLLELQLRPGRREHFDGLNSPETMATDPLISFKTALWYWMNFVPPGHRPRVQSHHRAMNGTLE